MSSPNSFKIEGSIKEIFDTQYIKDSFKKRELILEISDGGRYPQLIKFEFAQEDVSLPDNFKKDDRVIIEFTLKGREWRDPKGELKYFTTICGTAIYGRDSAPAEMNDVSDTITPPPGISIEDDLPF